MLIEIYGNSAPSDKTCREWFRRFKIDNFDVENKERAGQPRAFEDEELQALMDEDPCQTQNHLILWYKILILFAYCKFINAC